MRIAAPAALRGVCTIHQNQFKSDIDRPWAYLVDAIARSILDRR